MTTTIMRRWMDSRHMTTTMAATWRALLAVVFGGVVSRGDTMPGTLSPPAFASHYIMDRHTIFFLAFLS